MFAVYDIDVDGGFVIPENFADPIGGHSTVERSGIFGYDDTGIAEGIYNLGNVLPANFTQEEFEGLVVGATFVGEQGTGIRDLTLAYVVPEPTNYALFVGLIALAYRRPFARHSQC